MTTKYRREDFRVKVEITTQRQATASLVGRTIVAVKLRPVPPCEFATGNGFNPTLVLDDGAELTFDTQECWTEEHEYGTVITLHRPLKPKEK